MATKSRSGTGLAALLPCVCAGWLLGVLFGSVASPISARDVFSVMLIGVLAAGVGRATSLRLCAVGILGLLLGMTHADRAFRADADRRAAWQTVAGPSVVVEGSVRAVQRQRGMIRLDVAPVSVRAPEGDRLLPGALRATVISDAPVRENARVRLRGVVTVPDDREEETDARRRAFAMARTGVLATMRFPRLERFTEGRESVRTHVREFLHTRIRRSLPEPSASLLSALLLSYDEDLPRWFRDASAVSGLAHLIAISGSHLTLFAVMVFFGASFGGVGRGLASLCALLLSGGFLAVAGYPASGLRALVMISLTFWAYFAGRRLQGLRSLLLAAMLMTAVNPRLLVGDLGFQLSFLAMWGLVVLYPAFTRPGHRTVFGPLRAALGMTLAAELATMPLVLDVFHRLSVIGLVTNPLGAPLFPLLLVAALAVAFFGPLPGIGAIVSAGAVVLARVFERLVVLSAQVPGARLEAPVPSWVAAVLLALVLCLPFIPFPRRPRLQDSPAKLRT